jgi:hypothetical protein
MAYAIYETTDRLVVSARQAQTAANAAVTALGAGHATIEVDDGNRGHELPANFAPGFMYVTTGGVLVADPISGAIAKREATFGALAQLDFWEDNLNARGKGQPSVIRALGHDLLLGQRKALYLRATAATATAAGVQSYAGQISRGSSDIISVPTFFQKAAGINKGQWTDGDPVEWATLTGDVATRRLLQAAITAAPNDFRVNARNFSAIDLGTDDWVLTAITT